MPSHLAVYNMCHPGELNMAYTIVVVSGPETGRRFHFQQSCQSSAEPEADIYLEIDGKP